MLTQCLRRVFPTQTLASSVMKQTVQPRKSDAEMETNPIVYSPQLRPKPMTERLPHLKRSKTNTKSSPRGRSNDWKCTTQPCRHSFGQGANDHVRLPSVPQDPEPLTATNPRFDRHLTPWGGKQSFKKPRSANPAWLVNSPSADFSASRMQGSLVSRGPKKSLKLHGMVVTTWPRELRGSPRLPSLRGPSRSSGIDIARNIEKA